MNRILSLFDIGPILVPHCCENLGSDWLRESGVELTVAVDPAKTVVCV